MKYYVKLLNPVEVIYHIFNKKIDLSKTYHMLEAKELNFFIKIGFRFKAIGNVNIIREIIIIKN